MTPSNGFTTSNGITLHYLDWGGHGRPLIMVHALSFCADIWNPIAEALSQDYRVIAIDQRGHGKSDKPKGPYRWENFGNDLVGLIDGLHLKNAIAIGHSTGGTHVIMAAAKAPSLISSAVLFEPTIWSHDDWPTESRPNADWIRRRRNLWDTQEQIVRSYKPRSPFTRWNDKILRAYINGGFEATNDGLIKLRCHPDIEAELSENISNFNPKNHLDEIDCPVLWVIGDDSHPRQKAMMQQGAHLVRNCRVVYVEGTGHFIPQEKPMQTISLINQFQRAIN